ncbi:hypothetical protein JTB14_025028 [Gonioctena quinquepunctata]|nr:hypothetical protein JTB14_025028 [Gonioctena quinquepunctata]
MSYWSIISLPSVPFINPLIYLKNQDTVTTPDLREESDTKISMSRLKVLGKVHGSLFLPNEKKVKSPEAYTLMEAISINKIPSSALEKVIAENPNTH